MASSWVVVPWSTSRDVYMNGNVLEAAGVTNSPFVVETGMNDFALLTSTKEIEAGARKHIALAPKDEPIIVVLTRVS